MQDKPLSAPFGEEALHNPYASAVHEAGRLGMPVAEWARAYRCSNAFRAPLLPIVERKFTERR